MSHLYWELEEIPIPPSSYVSMNDGKVFIYTANGPRHASPRKVIGRATSRTTMIPNDEFRVRYPALWKQYYGEEVSAAQVMLPGLFSAVLGIVHQNGLYDCLRETVGTQNANAMLDYAMYSISCKSDSTINMEDWMADKVIFSRERHTDSWYSELFSKDLDADKVHAFKESWLRKCAERGTTEAWIAIDGSNNDCSASCSLAGKGKAKSGTDGTIVSFICAVSAQDGTPLTFDVNHGSVVDCKAVEAIVELLKNNGIRTSGLLLDRGFCSEDVLSSLDGRYDWVVMMKENMEGHKYMLELHAEDVSWKLENMIAPGPLFGCSGHGRMFSGGGREAYLNLYMHGMDKAERGAALADKVYAAILDMKGAIAGGKVPTVPQGLSKYLSVVESDDGGTEVVVDYPLWNADVSTKGYFTIASSRNLGAEAVDRLYDLRDSPEKTFAAIKTGLGCDVFRVHSSASIIGKFSVIFVAAVIRNEIKEACLANGLTTDKMIAELDRMEMLGSSSGTFVSVHAESERQKTLLSCWGIMPSTLDAIAKEYSFRQRSAVSSPVWTLPEEEYGHRKSGRKKETGEMKPQEEDQKPRRGRGRPKGSGKKKPQAEKVPSGRKPGRPPGSKNKKTLEREAAAAASGTIQEKRKPGRPKGSRDKVKRQGRKTKQNHDS